VLLLHIHVCVAYIPLDEFLDTLRKDKDFKEKAGLSRFSINNENKFDRDGGS